jgi:hypothetical protein
MLASTALGYDVAIDWMNVIFGVATLVGLLFAIVTYYASKAHVLQLVEKLKGARNNFNKIRGEADAICKALDGEGLNELRRGQALGVALTLRDGMHNYMNSVDDGVGDHWRSMNAWQIYKTFCARQNRKKPST